MLDRFRIVISIIRGTTTGEALRLMASGIIVSHSQRSDADLVWEKYMSCTDAVLKSSEKGIVFGTISMIDLQEQMLLETQLIKS